MKWDKKGFVFGPDKSLSWALNSALTPTPLLIENDTIRVYAGFRDVNGVSRIGYVDLDASNPKVIKSVSKKPVLDVGKPGAFDDNGVILGDVIRVGEEVWMYYVGFQMVDKVKFLAFSGLAISKDGGVNFQRYSDAPIMDRSSNGLYIRAIHSVVQEDDRFRVWYAIGNGWQKLQGKFYPKYHIMHIDSFDGVNFDGEGVLCVDVHDFEYRIGRPRVFKQGNGYCMHYTRGTTRGDYLAGYAESSDGISWVRRDSELGISLSENGWDSRHLCYPAIVNAGSETYMFYNGNDMGYAGFGYACLSKNIKICT
jgi:predicted GH43/DUF377 family glycosyl hydrolase